MIRDEKFKRLFWFTGGAICGLAMLSISKASVPSNVPANVTDDSAIYQSLSEIQVTKDSAPSFDTGISQLSRIENRYQDRLPNRSSRVSRQAYRRSTRIRSNSAWNEKIPAPQE